MLTRNHEEERMKRFLVLVAAVALILPLAAVSASSPRSGALHVTKECSAYTGLAGSYCTITSSNVNAIKVGFEGRLCLGGR